MRTPERTVPSAVAAAEVEPRRQRSSYPEPFASRVAGREKRQLGEVFGLTNYGVNLTTLAPGAMSALRHAHSVQDEFVYVLEGTPTLITDAGERELAPAMCAGFKAGSGDAHHLVNRGATAVVFLEIGDRAAGDAVVYPDDDVELLFGADGSLLFRHKDGSPYA